jgi:predicted Zn finger-like uncharacterized protein
MLIVCPACASRYEIAEAKIGAGGRKVRCASCQTTWQIEAQDAAAPAADALESEPASDEAGSIEFPDAPDASATAAELEAELRRAAAAEAGHASAQAESAVLAAAGRMRARVAGAETRRRVPAIAAMLAAAMAVSVLGLALWRREGVVRAMPQFAGLYEKIGLPVNIRGLAFSAIESELVQDAQGRFLVVEGDVTNITRAVVKVPPITVMVRSPDGQVLYRWTTEPPRPTLEPAELVHFRARLASPPENGRSIQVRFGAGAAGGVASLH